MRKLSSSLEDYLEAILSISMSSGTVRAKDIAERMRVRAASVTGALKLLAARKLIHYAPYGGVTLTPAGRRVARRVQSKHTRVLDFFTRVLGIRREDAEEFACRMEHAIPDPVLERIGAFSAFLEDHPDLAAAWRARRAAAKPAAPRPRAARGRTDGA